MNGPAYTSSVTAEVAFSARDEPARRRHLPSPLATGSQADRVSRRRGCPPCHQSVAIREGSARSDQYPNSGTDHSRAQGQRSRETFSAGQEEQQRTRRDPIFEIDGLSPTRPPQTRRISSITRASMDPPAAEQALVPKKANGSEGVPYDYEWSFGLEDAHECDVRMFLGRDEGLAQSQPWLFECAGIFVGVGRGREAWTSVAAPTNAREALHG